MKKAQLENKFKIKNLKLKMTLFFFFTFCILSFTFAKAFASTSVSGSVGDFYLNLSGYVSPYASIVMYTDSVFVRSAVADSQGNFYISQILVKEGFSSFCLDAVDYKRLGDSYTCFTIPPVEGTVTKDHIFLPPTLGLSRTEIGPNQSADAFGYTMPGARVYLHISNGSLLQIDADKDGYYILKVSSLPPGNYTLFASAVYNSKNSETPSRQKSLRSLSAIQEVGKSIKQPVVKTTTGLFNLLMTYIWLTIPVFILLIILILKPVRDKMRNLHSSMPAPQKQKGLHHAWFIGY